MVINPFQVEDRTESIKKNTIPKPPTPTGQNPFSQSSVGGYTKSVGGITKTFADEKAERNFRHTNPHDAYTKAVDMKYLNDIDNAYVNNKGVTQAQLNQYNNLAKTWNFDPTKNRVTNEVTKQIENQIAMQRKALEDQLATQVQSSQLAVNQNNAYLQEQLGKLQSQKNVTDNQSQMLANRRGGFYSGGLDYQLGQNASSFNEASGGLSRDVAQRNADIQAKNSLLASQVSSQISLLQQQAPDLIRQRITEELDRQRGIKMEEAQLTGQYNGAPTLANQQWQSEFGLQQQQFGLQQQGQQFDQMQVMASLTGYLPNGQPTTDQQQRELQNLWLASEQSGVIHPTLAQLYGIPKNTPTYAAKQDAIQNANESARLALSQQKEARVSSGGTGGKSSSSSKTSTGEVVKPKSASNSFNDGITYWSSVKDEVKKRGAVVIERSILNDPEALQEIRDNGFDIQSYIDSLYYVATDGQYKTKSDYDKMVAELYG